MTEQDFVKQYLHRMAAKKDPVLLDKAKWSKGRQRRITRNRERAQYKRLMRMLISGGDPYHDPYRSEMVRIAYMRPQFLLSSKHWDEEAREEHKRSILERSLQEKAEAFARFMSLVQNKGCYY